MYVESKGTKLNANYERLCDGGKKVDIDSVHSEITIGEIKSPVSARVFM